MAELLVLDVLTPVGSVASAKVPGVEVPGALGELGVLPGHIPFVSPLRPGVVRYRDGDKSVRIAVGAGFVEVSAGGTVSVLTEQALLGSEVDLDQARAELQQAEAELKGSHASLQSVERILLDQRVDWLSAQVRAAS